MSKADDDEIAAALRLDELLESLMSRHGFQVTLTRDRPAKGGKISIEFAYLSDSGSDELRDFDNAASAITAAAEAMDERDEHR